jgi:hypothetical protein
MSKMKPVKNNKNTAVSEVVSSVMLIGITIAMNLAVFSFANQQAGLSAQQYGTTVGNSIATLGEQFVVADLSYTSSGQNGFWCVLGTSTIRKL